MALAHEYVAIYPSGSTSPINDDPQGDAGASYSAVYTSMALMAAAEDGDYTGGDGTVLHPEIIDSDGSWDGSPDITQIEWEGWTTDQSGDGSFVDIKTYGGARSSEGNWDTTAYILQYSGGDELFEFDNDFSAGAYLDITFDGVQLEKTGTSDQLILFTDGGRHHNTFFKNCFIKQGTTATNILIDGLDDSGFYLKFENCIIQGGNEIYQDSTSSTGTRDFYNCTIHTAASGADALEFDGWAANVVNCAVFNNTDDFQDESGATIEYCATDEDGRTTNNCIDISATWDSTCFGNHATGDWTVQDVDSPLYHAGQNVTADAKVPSHDIAGNARPTGSNPVSIGAFELVSGQDYTLTATGGSYAMTGTAAGLLRAYLVDVGSGSYTLTGSDADLLRAYLVGAGSGSYTLTGSDADLLRAYLVGAGSGSYTLTGSTAALKYARIMAAGLGSYTLTGTAADLLRGYLVPAGLGSYALTGSTAALKYARIMAVAAGSYILTGTDAELTFAQANTLVAGSGNYTLAGTAADLLRGYLVPAGPGAYTQTGADAALKYARIMPAGAGTYTLAGTAADLLRAYLVAAGSGSYALTGTAADLLRGYLVSVGPGAYTLTGAAAVLKYARIMPAGAGTYTLAGTAADLLRAYLVAAGSGSYALTGTAADMLRGYLMEAAGGVYTLSGTAVTLTYSGFVLPSGQVIITFSIEKPRAAFTAKKPQAAFTAKKPSITLTSN